MRFLKKGEKEKPKSQPSSAVKGHPELQVISGSHISGRQPRQPTPQPQQQQQNITLSNIKSRLPVGKGA